MKPVTLILFGAGQVGRALVRMVLATRREQTRLGLRLEFVAFVDSGGALVDERGLNDRVLESALRLKERGESLATHERGYFAGDPAAIVDVAGQSGTVVIDATALDSVYITPALFHAGRLGYGVVLANKKPLTGRLEDFRQLTSGYASCHYEATVGAGLPVLRTLRMLLDTGDEVRTIRGALSGTLGFLMTEVQAGALFSSAVRQAKSLGYTEPDPRDDLSGLDVARKALILARTIGLEVEMDDVDVEALFPSGMMAEDVAGFMGRLQELDEVMGARVRQATAEGATLRYAAEVTRAGLRVGLSDQPATSPLGALQGSDNLVAFHTARYADRPLVVQGAGAGAVVTASAVLADILTSAREIG